MKLALVMVGLPARGKTYSARKISRFLSWRGIQTQVFNVGNYRRNLSGAKVPHLFFDPQNEEGMQARRQAAQAALNDMLDWFESGGEVGIYDATNSTRKRRDWVREILKGKGIEVTFLESICDDSSIIESNIRATKISSPDYVGIEADSAVRDFRARIAHYVSVYEPVNNPDYSWIKMIDAGRQVIVNHLDGYLQTRIAAFVMNLHLVPRPLWLSRHGQSQFNVDNKVGGDPALSDSGVLYAKSLKQFMNDKPVEEVWTSTLQRTIQTAADLGVSTKEWKLLDEIHAGVCDGMSYFEIERDMPEVHHARKADKLRYRYPQGESYEDVIERLEPIIFALEHRREPLLVVAHQAVLRAVYAYFTEQPRESCPYLSIPLHTVIQLIPQTYGCVEMRFSLPPHMSEGD
jgi:broad specificity phosphatase PhoE/predicted kinase